MFDKRHLVSLAAVVAVAVPATAAAATSHAKFWTNPSGSVNCGVKIHAAGHPATTILCGARGIPRPSNGGNTGDPFVQITAKGSPHLVLISQASFEGTTATKLPAGTSWSRLGVTCAVAAKTVKCHNGSGHGFTIGNGHYVAF